MSKNIRPLAAAVVATLLSACSGADKPTVDPHDQVAFPGSEAESRLGWTAFDPPAIRSKPVDRPANPENDPRCGKLDAETVEDLYRCETDGSSYVIR